MPQMNMIQALNSAMDIMLARDPNVVVLGEDVGFFGGVFRVTDGLQREIAAAASAPAVRARIEALGFQPTDPTAQDLARVQRAEYDAWAAVVKTIGFKPE